MDGCNIVRNVQHHVHSHGANGCNTCVCASISGSVGVIVDNGLGTGASTVVSVSVCIGANAGVCFSIGISAVTVTEDVERNYFKTARRSGLYSRICMIRM